MTQFIKREPIKFCTIYLNNFILFFINLVKNLFNDFDYQIIIITNTNYYVKMNGNFKI